MDRGIWAIWYDLPAEHKAEYLEWFHHVHIPDKLARPGYVWAAHYELEVDKGYLALFGGATAHTFLNPSPGQLLLRQSTETKHFMSIRRHSSACILAEEIRVDGPAAAQRGPGMTTGPVIQMGNYNAASPAVEDDLGAWYAQERLPLLAKLPGCIGARKMLATAGAYKHAILHEFVSLEMREQHFAPHEAAAHDPNTWMGRVRPQLTHSARSPAVGKRIWPVVNA
ncbi:MAG: hypothetical protein K8S22_02690 [Betaproteobacteria bacterium]|nr:hypothetical protein [Betaproteobacteria bacterium]